MGASDLAQQQENVLLIPGPGFDTHPLDLFWINVFILQGTNSTASKTGLLSEIKPYLSVDSCPSEEFERTASTQQAHMKPHG